MQMFFALGVARAYVEMPMKIGKSNELLRIN